LLFTVHAHAKSATEEEIELASYIYNTTASSVSRSALLAFTYIYDLIY